ncbi:ATP-binding protein [Sphingobacterium sp. SRCM116780]|uniref:ligand-binding sensor domain-containing protein n=1 Tax=Sphingobacterium sp. SRCM116780 TaxID=2907623 RepID=UPI001F45983C|nr:sensor histidine kinase [Sphingobacterium sp. SRCM116780]UIR54737.1 ATP-binding protein [Sphingobacterium sp. SRCM116780]
MIKFKSLLLYLACFFLSLNSYAQPYYFNHYQINEGLSNNAVICSMQDSYGFLWFGTKDGLNRFDGNNFKLFTSSHQDKNSLGSNSIISLREDYQKHMWIGTDQGIYSYDPIHEKFRLLSEKFRGTEVPVIIADNKHKLWFISNGALYVYNIDNKETTQITKSEYYVTSINTTRAGVIYFGTPEGTIYTVCDNNKVTLLLDFTKTFGKKDWYSIEKIVETRQGELLIGTSKAGVFTYKPATHTLTSILGQKQLKQFLYVRDIIQPNDQEYWFATESGLFIYRIANNTYIHLHKEKNNPWGISDNAIYNILQDKDKGIWLGTYFGGLNYYHAHNSIIEKILPGDSSSLQGSVVRAIKKDQEGHIWIGTENGGLAKWDLSTNKIQNFTSQNSSLANNNIHGVLPVGDKLLVSTFVNGLDIFDLKKEKVIQHLDRNSYRDSELESNFIFYLYQTRNGDIFAGSTRGLYRFDPKSKQFYLIKNVPIYIFYTTILEDSQGNLWIGTWRDGLFCYNPKSQYFKHYTQQSNDDHSLPNNRINSLFEDSKKQLWIATEGGMVRKQVNKNGFDCISMKDGMPSNVILSFLEDKEKNIWAATSKGLVKYNPQTNQLRVFNMESGLSTLQFNYNSSFDDKNGYFYFGTINGLIRFKPEKLNQIHYSSTTPIFITNLTVNNREVNQINDSTILKKSILFTDHIQLKHDESSFSLDFAALHYQAPHSVQYSYKMEGMDEKWTKITGNHRAYFTKLAPGKYTFIVKAEDPNGIAIPQIKSLAIQVLPPIWASISAFIIYSIILIGLVIFIIHHFNEKIKQRNRQHILTIQNLREQQLYRSKINFYTDVAHEIRTPLTLIKAPLEKLMDKVDRNPAIDKLLLTMQNNTEKLIELSNQLLDFRKVEAEGFKLHFETENVSQILQNILNNFSVTLLAKHKLLRINIQENIIALIDADAFEKICSNLLNNALKYSEQHIEVILEENRKENMFILCIKNDGSLIPKEERERIFEPFNRSKQTKNIPGSGLGLALTKTLALKHQGTLIYAPDHFNTFILMLPLNQSENLSS